MQRQFIKKRILGLLLVVIFMFIFTTDVHASKMIETQSELYDELLEIVKEKKSMATIYTTFPPETINFEGLEERAKLEGEYFSANLPTFQFQSSEVSGGYKVEILMGSIYNPTKFQEKRLDVVVNGLVQDCEGMSDYEKIRYVHDYIVLNCEYEGTRDGAYQALCNGKACCNGYARGFLRVMEAMDIPCKYTTNTEHAWNTVYLEGEWYNLDTTWDDLGGDQISYEYFLKSNADWTGEGPTVATTSKSYVVDPTLRDYHFRNYMFWSNLQIAMFAFVLLVIVMFLIRALSSYQKKKSKRKYEEGLLAMKTAYLPQNNNEYSSPYDNLD